MGTSDLARHAARHVIIEQYRCVGYNYRMTDIQAAIGIEQVKKLDWIITRRRILAARYTQALARHPWFQVPYVPEYTEPTFQSYAVQLTNKAILDRNELMQRLLDRDIHTRRGVMLAHTEIPYAGSAELPRSENASVRSLLLPLYPRMTNAEQDQVIEALFEIAEEERPSRLLNSA
jgi:dTDP-4-amino-4,6-dideoxygalactose transaminase